MNNTRGLRNIGAISKKYKRNVPIECGVTFTENKPVYDTRSSVSVHTQRCYDKIVFILLPNKIIWFYHKINK